VDVRMRVRVARLAVGGPARVTDADGAAQALRQGRLERRDLADRLVNPESAACDDGDARRIVPPVFQTVKARQQDRRCLLPADVSDDATHESTPLSAVNQATDLALRERRGCKAPPAHLVGDATEDLVVPQTLGLQLAVTTRHELLDRLREERQELL